MYRTPFPPAPAFRRPPTKQPPLLPSKNFSDCPVLECFHAFEPDDEDDLNRIQMDGKVERDPAICCFWEPAAGRTDDDRALFLTAAEQLIEQYGGELFEHATYLHGQVLTERGWERLFVTCLSTNDTRQ